MKSIFLPRVRLLVIALLSTIAGSAAVADVASTSSSFGTGLLTSLSCRTSGGPYLEYVMALIYESLWDDRPC